MIEIINPIGWILIASAFACFFLLPRKSQRNKQTVSN